MAEALTARIKWDNTVKATSSFKCLWLNQILADRNYTSETHSL